MVMVTCETPMEASSSRYAGRASPLVARQSIMFGKRFRTRFSVRSVADALAMGSPGPAMPTTVILGSFSTTRSRYFNACSGARTALVTPGRLSFMQSYLRLQYWHLMLQVAATGR